MSIKITRMEIENVKRVRAVTLEPSETGLTVIGGRNGQGKTSVLDAIVWALGGEKYRPTAPKREDSTVPPHIRIQLSNGLVIERAGVNSTLKVIDPTGVRAGQKLLDSFVEQFALDLPQFLTASDRDKAIALLRILGLDERLAQLENDEKIAYDRRRTIGQIADQKTKYANEMSYYPTAPAGLVSASELIRQQQAILAKNGANERLRQRKTQLAKELEGLNQQCAELQKCMEATQESYAIACRDADDLRDENTAELEHNIATIEETNRMVRANLDRSRAEDEAQIYRDQYQQLTDQIEKARQAKRELLNSADMPLPDLTIADGILLYRGQAWDCMSSAEQLRVGTAIVRRLNPECGFVLLDKLEQMDVDTMRVFGDWLEAEGLQAIATRVSTGDECSIVIEDGQITATKESSDEKQPVKWQKGAF